MSDKSFKSSQSTSIHGCSLVKVKQMNNIVEVMALKNSCTGFNNIKKLSKTEYMMLDTGEIKEYNISENRAQNIESFKKTTKRIRDLINNNFTGAGNELHLTLTYAENMTDTKRLYYDFDKFWKKYKYRYGKNIDYISVVEPQDRGAWHCHVLIRHNDSDKIFIPNNELAELWGHGFTKTKSLKNVDNIGAYLSAYLADIELTQDVTFNPSLVGLEIKEVDMEGQKKKFIKGGRVHMYPPGMNIVRKSKGILYPEVEEMPYYKAKKIVGDKSPNWSKTVTIVDSDDKVIQEISYESYNLKRARNTFDD